MYRTQGYAVTQTIASGPFRQDIKGHNSVWYMSFPLVWKISHGPSFTGQWVESMERWLLGLFCTAQCTLRFQFICLKALTPQEGNFLQLRDSGIIQICTRKSEICSLTRLIPVYSNLWHLLPVLHPPLLLRAHKKVFTTHTQKKIPSKLVLYHHLTKLCGISCLLLFLLQFLSSLQISYYSSILHKSAFTFTSTALKHSYCCIWEDRRVGNKLYFLYNQCRNPLRLLKHDPFIMQ